MKARKLSRWLSLFLVLSLLPIMGLGVAGAAPLGQETYTVQKDDSLWNIAEKYLGSGAGYPAIVDATNKKHAEDPTFPEIVNPGLIQPGWKLAIPSTGEAEEFMAGYVSLAAKASGKIALYTSVPQPIADKIQADFQAKFPKITLDIFRAGTSEVVAKVMTEKEAGAIQADLIWVAEPSTYEDFKDQDMLLKYAPPESALLPAEMKDPDGYYYAGRLINMIVAYNTAVTTPPKGWLDLLKPEYQATQGFPTPLRSGAAEGAVKTLVDVYGWKYFDDFKANGGVQVQNNSAMRDQLSAGEFMVGVLLDYMVREATAKGSPIDYVWPEEGAVFIPSPVAILNTTQNPDAAKVFVDYILSKDGQETMVELGNFIPVRPDVDPPEGAPSLGQINKLPTDWKAVQENRQATKDQWTAIFGE
jgi:iron(III) transport system substrate-binding protein